MDGIELPAELEHVLEEIGIQWPDTKEIALGERSSDYGRFVVQGALSDAAATGAVRTLLAANQSDGLTAFGNHFGKLGGPQGHMTRALAVNTATGVGVGAAAAAVLDYKLLVLDVLGGVAAEGVVAAATAFETGGASLLAYAELVAEEASAVYAAEAALIAGLEAIGSSASLVADDVLDVAIKGLQSRELHSSPDGVTAFPTREERDRAAAVYERRWDELSYDPDKKSINAGSRREATVALGLEKAGRFPPGSVLRAGAGGGDFVVVASDGTQQAWDIKTFPSYDPAGIIKQKYCYSDDAAEAAVSGELGAGENVVFDTSRMSKADIQSFVSLVRRHPEWSGKVLVY